jgi:hypothetical protein
MLAYFSTAADCSKIRSFSFNENEKKFENADGYFLAQDLFLNLAFRQTAKVHFSNRNGANLKDASLGSDFSHT